MNKLISVVILISSCLYSTSIKIYGEYKNISPLFFGINSLYWIDNDKTRNNIEYVNALKNAQVSIIRYPGGEVADNFDWKTNRLYDRSAYPYSKKKDAYKKRMDFDEFVKWKDKIGAKAILVVNLEEGFLEGDLKKAAKKAAEWVRYANIEKKYNIKYWEIGNESYHLGTRYPLTAKEYAQALKLFSREMKKVDPTIKVGAVGPWDYKKVPILEYLPKRKVEELRSLKSFKERKRLAKRLKRQYRKQKIKERKKSWWQVIAEEASGSFDFAVIHRYTNRRIRDKDLKKPLRCDEPVFMLRSFLRAKTGKTYPIALTEYNVGRKSGRRLSKIALSLTLAEMMGDYLKAGVHIANYWPVRLKDKRTMFGPLDMGEKPPYYVFKALSDNIGEYLIHAKSDDNMVYTIASCSEASELNLFIVNKKIAKEKIKLHLKKSEFLKKIYEISDENLVLHSSKNIKPMKLKKNSAIYISPLSITILKFDRGSCREYMKGKK